ncbi:MAG: GGDEF domain-containing protein [bacterium]|nr:GGDEF domain-containing protein [bacterium]
MISWYSFSLSTVQTLAHTTARAQELERENQELATLAQTDKLTDLRNRAGFDAALQHIIETRLQHDHSDALGLLMLDIDHFKNFNDTYGHLLGDEVLRQVAEWITASVRHTDIAARYGGEEFVVLLPHTAFDVLHKVAERIRTHISEGKVVSQGKKLTVTISIGGAWVHRVQSPKDGVDLLKLADACLYEAKDAGRNQTICRQAPCL